MTVISTDDVKSLMAKKADFALVNVLSAEAFERGHIPGSLNIPVDSDDFFDRMSEAVGGDKGKGVVVYCANESCDASTRAAKKLSDAGYSSVFAYEGGLDAWRAAGQEVVTGAAAE